MSWLQLTLAPHVRPRISHVEHGRVGPAGSDADRETGHGRPHPRPLGPKENIAEDGIVRPPSGRHQISNSDSRFIQQQRKSLDGQLRGHLARGVTTHAVGHDEQRRGGQQGVLVGSPFSPDVGTGTPPQVDRTVAYFHRRPGYVPQIRFGGGDQSPCEGRATRDSCP